MMETQYADRTNIEIWQTSAPDPDNDTLGLRLVGTINADAGEHFISPEIQHVGGDVFIAHVTHNNTLYLLVTYDGGKTWESYQYSPAGTIISEGYRNCDISDNGSMTMWQSDNSTGEDIRWQLCYTFNTGKIEGHCTYEDGGPLTQIEVVINNRYNNHSLPAFTIGNYYWLNMLLRIDLRCDPFPCLLRIIARDPIADDVNISDFSITDVPFPVMTMPTLIMSPHYRDIKDFPFYYAENISGVRQAGAAVGKMFLVYLNQTMISQQDVYTGFKALTPSGYWSGWYDAPLYITAYEMLFGVGEPCAEFGYGFMAYADVNATTMLKAVCSLIDYTVAADPGHPTHVPAAIPTGGDYSHWMVVRGIHTSRNTYPVPESYTMYGFWVNDPSVDGIGENTYKTVTELTTNYFKPLTGIPSGTEKGKYTIVVEPPEDFDVRADTGTVTIGNQPGEYTASQKQIIQRVTQLGKTTLADQVIYTVAKNSVEGILALEDKNLAGYKPVQVTRVDNRVGDDYNIVVFSNGADTVAVRLNAASGKLLEFSEASNVTGYLTGVGVAVYDGDGSPFYPYALE
jgi:hypothetical protein